MTNKQESEKFNSLIQKIDDLTKTNLNLTSEYNKIKLKVAELQCEKFSLTQTNK